MPAPTLRPIRVTVALNSEADSEQPGLGELTFAQAQLQKTGDGPQRRAPGRDDGDQDLAGGGTREISVQ